MLLDRPGGLSLPSRCRPPSTNVPPVFKGGLQGGGGAELRPPGIMKTGLVFVLTFVPFVFVVFVLIVFAFAFGLGFGYWWRMWWLLIFVRHHERSGCADWI